MQYFLSLGSNRALSNRSEKKNPSSHLRKRTDHGLRSPPHCSVLGKTELRESCLVFVSSTPLDPACTKLLISSQPWGTPFLTVTSGSFFVLNQPGYFQVLRAILPDEEQKHSEGSDWGEFSASATKTPLSRINYVLPLLNLI